MCHWVLRIVSLSVPSSGNYLTGTQWKCGDSYFTKYSPCSYDRAAYAILGGMQSRQRLLTGLQYPGMLRIPD